MMCPDNINGRVAAVLSAHGLTCSIEGTPCPQDRNYTTGDAMKLALNLVLYAASQAAHMNR